jgi:hypothetical protein
MMDGSMESARRNQMKMKTVLAVLTEDTVGGKAGYVSTNKRKSRN